MTEQHEGLLDSLSKVSTIDDLKATLPLSMTEKLGEGEKGVNQAIALLNGLAPFAPYPATFDQGAFNSVVAFDEETGDPLPPEEAQRMLEVAVEAGFIKREEKERYSVNPQVKQTVKRVLGEE